VKKIACGIGASSHCLYPLCKDTLAGLIERVCDWEAELDWIRAAGRDGCILFENIG
jgi:phosphoribosylamine---glycine ligase